MKQPTITFSKGGTKEKTVLLSQVRIPDLWHTVTAPPRRDILECWHMAHDLLRELREAHTRIAALEAEVTVLEEFREEYFKGEQ